jgi:hypothetical protein
MTLVLLHFPDGTREFRYGRKPPRAGNLVVHLGERYRIVTVEWTSYGDHVVTVTPEASSSSAHDADTTDRLGLVAASS